MKKDHIGFLCLALLLSLVTACVYGIVSVVDDISNRRVKQSIVYPEKTKFYRIHLPDNKSISVKYIEYFDTTTKDLKGKLNIHRAINYISTNDSTGMIFPPYKIDTLKR